MKKFINFILRSFLEKKCIDIIENSMEYIGENDEIFQEVKQTSIKDLFRFYIDYLRGVKT